nr:immunoglobulin heavy chain junction region [Macaca mulatta]
CARDTAGFFDKW